MEILCAKQAHDVASDAIAARIGVKGDFIRVSQLAKALGISATTIHSQIRRGNFPIAHRKVGNVILVKLDDYVRWFENGGIIITECDEPTGIAIDNPQNDEHLVELQAMRMNQLPMRESKAQMKARVQSEVLTDMRNKGFNV
jgi:hypothetical protein